MIFAFFGYCEPSAPPDGDEFQKTAPPMVGGHLPSVNDYQMDGSRYRRKEIGLDPEGCASKTNAVMKARATNLSNLHFVEPEALQHARDRASRIVASDFENAILQRSLLELALSFFAHFAFQVWVRGRKEAGVA